MMQAFDPSRERTYEEGANMCMHIHYMDHYMFSHEVARKPFYAHTSSFILIRVKKDDRISQLKLPVCTELEQTMEDIFRRCNPDDLWPDKSLLRPVVC